MSFLEANNVSDLKDKTKKENNKWTNKNIEHGQQINATDNVHESNDFCSVANFQCLTSRDLICSYFCRLMWAFFLFLM